MVSMKQYITEKQFNGLPKKAQETLKAWTIERGYAIDAGFYGYQFDPIDDGKIWTAYPSLSIGQLIGFLVDRRKDIHNLSTVKELETQPCKVSPCKAKNQNT